MLALAIRSFGYSEKTILNEIAFEVNKGEHLAVLGESGCGKSTLLHLIYGLLHLENGEIYLEETAINGSEAHSNSRRALYEIGGTRIQCTAI